MRTKEKRLKPYPVNDTARFWEDGEQLSIAEFSDFINKNDKASKKEKIKLNGYELNELTGSEWTLLSKSVQVYNGPITEKRKKHGAAFPLSLAKHFIQIYSKPGDTILDPFAGVGTTLDAANILKRHSIGIELNNDFIKLFNLGIDPKDGQPNLNFRRVMINDSTLNLWRHLKEDSIDFILTSPPYSHLLNIIRENFADKDFKGNKYKNQHRRLAKPYSKHDEDLGNVSYEKYLEKMKEIFALLNHVAKPGSYNAWVVRDYRDSDNNVPYISLHSDLMKVATQSGWVMWDMVIWDQSNQRKLVRLGVDYNEGYLLQVA